MYKQIAKHVLGISSLAYLVDTFGRGFYSYVTQNWEVFGESAFSKLIRLLPEYGLGNEIGAVVVFTPQLVSIVASSWYLNYLFRSLDNTMKQETLDKYVMSLDE